MKNHKNYGNRNQHRQELQPERPVTTKMGHNGQKVLIEYDRPVHNLMMTIEQVDQFIQNLQGAKKMLIDHMYQTARDSDNKDKEIAPSQSEITRRILA